MVTTEIPFHADPAFRPRAIGSRSPIEPGLRVALFAATLIYSLLFAGLTADLRFAPRPAPVPHEIPVEIVSEPEPPPEAKQPPVQIPIVEPEAHDAPRAVTADHDTEVVGKSEKAAPAPAPIPPSDQKPENPQDNAKPAEAAANPETKPLDSEAPSPDAPPAPVADGDTPPPQAAKVDPKPPARASEKFSLPASAYEPVPDVDFGAPAMKALISGGRGRGAYMNVLFGLIVRHIHIPPGTSKGLPGVVSFVIDGKGRLTDRQVTRSSGLPELDAAIFEAIAQASPFPPPPGRVPTPLEFTYNNKD